MSIDGISGFDSLERYEGFTDSKTMPIESREGQIAKEVFANFPMTSSGKSFKIAPMGGTVGASAEAKADNDGNTKVEVEAHVKVNDDQGTTVSLSGSGSVKTDNDGSVKAEGTVKVSVSKDF
jgi:hypothetical protein